MWGLDWDNGKEHGNYHSILSLYGDKGKEYGNYYSILGVYRVNGKEDGNYCHDRWRWCTSDFSTMF